MSLQLITDHDKISAAVKNRFKITKGFKEFTSKYFPIYIWENKNKKIVSSTRNPKDCVTIRKRLAKNSNLSPYVPYERATYVRTSSRRIELQEYKIYLTFVDGIEHINLELVNFMKLENNTLIRCHCFGNEIIAGFTSFGPSMYSSAFSSMVYPNYSMENSELKYISFDDIYSNFTNFAKFIERIYKYRYEIEFCQKVGAIKFADAIASGNPNADMRIITKKWLRTHKYILKKNPETNYFSIQNEIKSLADQLRVKASKLSNYLSKHDSSIEIYRKHVENLIKLNYPFEKKYLFPSNFKEVRQEIETIIQDLEFESENSKFLEISKEFSPTCNKTLSGYTFLVPTSTACVIREGIELNNCLKSYITKIVSKKSLIIFVRSIHEPGKSLYALEISPDLHEIRQFHGVNNSTPSEKARKAVDRYIKSLEKFIAA